MRFNHLLILSVLLPLAACQKTAEYGQNASLPTAVDICYDDIISGPSTVAVYWNGKPAIRAGAESFTVQLVKSDKDYAGDNYNTSLSTTYTVRGLEYPGQAVFAGLKGGTKYYVRVRANYPEGKMSLWQYLFDESLEKTGVVKVGQGLVDEPVSRLATPSAVIAMATSSTLSFRFSSTQFMEYDTDIDRNYNIGLYRDEACSDLVVSWNINKACGTAFSISNPPSFIFTGLEPDTQYWFRAVDKTEGADYSNIVAASTTPFTNSTLAASANPGDVILAEDFGELIWGGSWLNSENAAGYSSGARGYAPVLEPALGENPLGGPYQYYLVGVGQDMQLFGSLSNAIPNTRLASWGYISKNNNTACMCAQAGHVKCGTGAGEASIVTPELTCLSGTARINVSFKAQCMSDTDNPAMCVKILRNSTMDENHAVSTDPSDAIIGAQFAASDIKADAYSFDIGGVQPGDRIAIGGDSTKANSYAMRSFIDEIVITLVNYE